MAGTPPWEQPASATPPWETSSPAKDSSLSGKIAADAGKRYHNELDVIGANVTGKETLPLTALRTLGEAGGLEKDVAGDIAGEFTPGIVKRGINDAAQAVANSKVGRAVGEKVDEFSKAHPHTAEAIGALGNVSGAKGAVEGLKSAPKVLNDAIGAAKTIPGKTITDIPEKIASKIKPVDPEIANIVKSAEKAGIKVPTAGLLPKGGMLAEHANVSGMKEYTEAVNRKAADLIGANDGETKFGVVNEKALNAANNRVSEDFDKVAKEIGKVHIGQPVSKTEQLSHSLHNITPPETPYSRIAKIVNDAAPTDRPGWKRIVTDAQGLVDKNGDIDASSIKKLISYNSELAKKARSASSDAGEAQKIISILKGSLYDAANDVQKVELSNLDHKYKLIIAFDKAGARVGAGQNLKPEKIRDVLDAAYKESGENDYPARELKTLLDTLHPVSGTESSIQGLTNPKLSAGVMNTQNPLHGSVTGRALEYVPSKVSSAIVNRPGFRSRLLGEDRDALGATVEPLTAK